MNEPTRIPASTTLNAIAVGLTTGKGGTLTISFFPAMIDPDEGINEPESWTCSCAGAGPATEYSASILPDALEGLLTKMGWYDNAQLNRADISNIRTE